jgi:hypothetical protein
LSELKFPYKPRKKGQKGTEQGKAEQEDTKRRKRRYLGQARSPEESRQRNGKDARKARGNESENKRGAAKREPRSQERNRTT